MKIWGKIWLMFTVWRRFFFSILIWFCFFILINTIKQYLQTQRDVTNRHWRWKLFYEKRFYFVDVEDDFKLIFINTVRVLLSRAEHSFSEEHLELDFIVTGKLNQYDGCHSKVWQVIKKWNCEELANHLNYSTLITLI